MLRFFEVREKQRLKSLTARLKGLAERFYQLKTE
jgi:hypothetical protein